MRIILSDFISLDGVVQAPAAPRRTPTAASGTAAGRCRSSTPRRWGRSSTRSWADRRAAVRAAHVGGDGVGVARSAGDPFADRMNAIPKYVVSARCRGRSSTWKTRRCCGRRRDPARSALQGEDGGDIQVMGSASLAAQLVENDLVDEYRLMLEPILLGGGKRIFPDDGSARPLELVSATPAGTGVLVCTYRPAGD